MESIKDNNIINAQANFLKIEQYIRYIKREARKIGIRGMCASNNELLSLTIKNLGLLTKDENETSGIRAFKNSGFYFNSSIEENGPELNTKFWYNRPAEYIINLEKEKGKNIFDLRFKSAYRYTKFKLRKKYEENFQNWVEKNATLHLQDITNATLKALAQMREEDIVFNDKYHQKNQSVYFDSLIKIIPQLTALYIN